MNVHVHDDYRNRLDLAAGLEDETIQHVVEKALDAYFAQNRERLEKIGEFMLSRYDETGQIDPKGVRRKTAYRNALRRLLANRDRLTSKGQ